MKLGVLTGQLNKWQAGIAFGKAPDWQVAVLRKQPFRFIHIWCMKLVSLPPPNEIINPEYYQGFRFYKEFPMT
jgi:hypothetical protein